MSALVLDLDAQRDIRDGGLPAGVRYAGDGIRMSRDRVGLSSVFFSVSGSRLIVSDSLFDVAEALGAVTADPVSVCEHLTYRYVSGSRTLFREIARVPAGYTVQAAPRGGEWRISTTRTQRYDWGDQRTKTHSVLSALIEERLRSVISGHCRTGCGVFFSGGLDSCIVASLCHDRPVCYNVTPSDTGLDESHYASTAAGHLGLGLEVRRFDHSGFMESVRKAVEMTQGTLPVEQIAMYSFLAENTELPSLMLTGYGADYLLGESQRKYWAVLQAARLLGMDLVSCGATLYGSLGTRQHQQAAAIREFLSRLGRGQMWVDMLPALDPPCNPEIARRAMGMEVLPDYHEHRRRLLSDEMPPHFTQRIFVTYGNLIAETVSSWSRLCAAHGRGLSIPFLDPSLVDLVTSLSPTSYLSLWKAKPPIRMIASRILTKSLLDRPKLHGLIPPSFLLADGTGMLAQSLERIGGRGIADPSVLVAAAAERQRYSYIPVWAALNMEVLFECLEERHVSIL